MLQGWLVKAHHLNVPKVLWYYGKRDFNTVFLIQKLKVAPSHCPSHSVAVVSFLDAVPVT